MRKSLIFVSLFVFLFPLTGICQDTSELCQQATMAKAKGDVCLAYQLYKLAQSNGYPNDTCKRHGDTFILAHANECHNSQELVIKKEHLVPEYYEESNSNTKSGIDPVKLCDQATMAKAKGEVCLAYHLYKEVKIAGYPNDTCKKHGDNYINSHFTECSDTTDSFTEQISKLRVVDSHSPRHNRLFNTKYCTYATMAIERNKVCKAYEYYRYFLNNKKALKNSSESIKENCEKEAESFVAAHEKDCQAEIEKERKNRKMLPAKFHSVGGKLCDEAKTSTYSAKTCDAYVYYKKIEELNLDDDAVKCNKIVKAFIANHAKECANPSKDQAKLIPNLAETLCKEAKEYESKNGITAYNYYGAVQLLGYPDNSCKTQAEKYLSDNPKYDISIGSGPADPDVLCFDAMIAVKEGDNNKAINFFELARKAGYPDEDCQKQGDEYLATHKKTISKSLNAAIAAEREQRRAERQALLEVKRAERQAQLEAKRAQREAEKEQRKAEREQRKAEIQAQREAEKQKREEWKQALEEMDPDERKEALEERRQAREDQQISNVIKSIQKAEEISQKNAEKQEAKKPVAYKLPNYQKMNEKALCQEAVKARENNSVCGTYEIYEYALAQGIKDLKCQQNAKKYVQAHRSDCANSTSE